MNECRFYHVEGRRPAAALLNLLTQMLAEGRRAVVQFPDQGALDSIDEALWTLEPASFLPHGTARDGEAEAQPAYLTCGEETPNGARTRILMSGVDPLGAPQADETILLFDGADASARDEARLHWSALKAAGRAVSYWRESETGGWAKRR